MYFDDLVNLYNILLYDNFILYINLSNNTNNIISANSFITCII